MATRRAGRRPSAAGAVHVGVGAIASRRNADRSTPTALPQQWESTFRLHAAPLLDMPLDRITSADVLACLAPIWNSKPGAARKARHRIAAVFRWCIGKNLRPDRLSATMRRGSIGCPPTSL